MYTLLTISHGTPRRYKNWIVVDQRKDSEILDLKIPDISLNSSFPSPFPSVLIN